MRAIKKTNGVVATGKCEWCADASLACPKTKKIYVLWNLLKMVVGFFSVFPPFAAPWTQTCDKSIHMCVCVYASSSGRVEKFTRLPTTRFIYSHFTRDKLSFTKERNCLVACRMCMSNGANTESAVYASRPHIHSTHTPWWQTKLFTRALLPAAEMKKLKNRDKHTPKKTSTVYKKKVGVCASASADSKHEI